MFGKQHGRTLAGHEGYGDREKHNLVTLRVPLGAGMVGDFLQWRSQAVR